MEKRTILHIYTDSPSFQTIAKIIITYKISKTGKLLQLLSRETDLEPVTRATLRTAAAPGVSSEGGNTFLQHDLRSYMGELKYLQFRCYFKKNKNQIVSHNDTVMLYQPQFISIHGTCSELPGIKGVYWKRWLSHDTLAEENKRCIYWSVFRHYETKWPMVTHCLRC